MYTYHLRFIPEGVAEASQIFLETPTFYQNYLAMSSYDTSEPNNVSIPILQT
jgi:hypothetical protein